MKIGVIGDDFTGSSDIANVLARAGARTIQVSGVPNRRLDRDVDAVVIALKTRSAPMEIAVRQSLTACRWLRAQGVEQIVFKYCSTFDSTPAGNIGPVMEALMREIDAPVALACPAFPANGRTVYQGHLFIHDRLLNESGMQNHPVTPMTDPDIRRWLQRQTTLKVGHLPLAELRAGNADAALAAALSRDEAIIIADAITDADLLALGSVARRHRLVTGGSAIAAGLPANFGIRRIGGGSSAFSGEAGPSIILSGSCSAATREQVGAYSRGRPALEIDARSALDFETVLLRAIRFIRDNLHDAPLIFSSADPATVANAQSEFGAERVSAALDRLFAAIALEAVEAAGIEKIVVAGGETSGAVTAAFGPVAFDIGPEIDTGVPVLHTKAPRKLALALKSGNFGSMDFFEKALRVLGDGGAGEQDRSGAAG